MLIALLIIAMLAAVGGPSLARVVTGNKLRSEADRVLLSLSQARSEAIKNNTPATICRSSNGSSCTGEWKDGWILFRNVDGDEVVDGGDGDQVLRVYPAIASGYTLGSNLSTNVITYNPDGSYNGGDAVIRVCGPSADTTIAWSIILNRVGKSRLSHTTSSCP